MGNDSKRIEIISVIGALLAAKYGIVFILYFKDITMRFK